MSHDKTQSNNEPQENNSRLDELSDEALDNLISTDESGSLGAWDRA